VREEPDYLMAHIENAVSYPRTGKAKFEWPKVPSELRSRRQHVVVYSHGGTRGDGVEMAAHLGQQLAGKEARKALAAAKGDPSIDLNSVGIGKTANGKFSTGKRKNTSDSGPSPKRRKLANGESSGGKSLTLNLHDRAPLVSCSASDSETVGLSLESMKLSGSPRNWSVTTRSFCTVLRAGRIKGVRRKNLQNHIF
jgi:hypothetical protein